MPHAHSTPSPPKVLLFSDFAPLLPFRSILGSPPTALPERRPKLRGRCFSAAALGSLALAPTNASPCPPLTTGLGCWPLAPRKELPPRRAGVAMWFWAWGSSAKKKNGPGGGGVRRRPSPAGREDTWLEVGGRRRRSSVCVGRRRRTGGRETENYYLSVQAGEGKRGSCG